MPMMYGNYGMGWFGGFFMMIVPLVIFGLIVYWAVNARDKKGQGSSEALDILKVRFARNEITEDEYRRLKEEISR